MRRANFLRALVVAHGIGLGLSTVPGCGTDASGGPKIPPTSGPAGGATAGKADSAPVAAPASTSRVDTTSRRQHQKSMKP